MGWVPVFPDHGLESLMRVRAGTQEILLLRAGDNVFATETLCPHKFGPLEEGHVEDGCLVCPLHDAHFDPASGDPRAGDEWAGTLRTFECRVRDGMVEVRV